ncbi:uncharacterized protein VTP21DRAFT_8108 [Calcarisporiella thermophila]|uniref:uncharacterized protein n=1 Tax=Calcarisporiella thermophila TaxID=911321 RepID=UPI0037437473
MSKPRGAIRLILLFIFIFVPVLARPLAPARLSLKEREVSEAFQNCKGETCYGSCRGCDCSPQSWTLECYPHCCLSGQTRGSGTSESAETEAQEGMDAKAFRQSSWPQRPDSGYYEYPPITPARGIFGSLLILIGLYLLFASTYYYRVTYSLITLMLATTLSYIALANAEPPWGYENRHVVYMAVPLTAGMLGAGGGAFLGRMGPYVAGGAGGMSMGVHLLSWNEHHVIYNEMARYFVLAFFVVVGVFLAGSMQGHAVILSLAFMGAMCVMLGVDYFTNAGMQRAVIDLVDRNVLHAVEYSPSWRMYVELVSVLVLFLMGAAVTHRVSRRRKFVGADNADDDFSDELGDTADKKEEGEVEEKGDGEKKE